MPSAMLVISLPASADGGAGVSPTRDANDEEVGGVRGRMALAALRNVVSRVAAAWRPANAEESFEIVRRRLFQPLPEPNYPSRDNTAKAFCDLYRSNHQEFPSECREVDYERKLKAAYPIHPEIFERLYQDWSGLVKFQRTRGVLRLMAAVIHQLWESNDRSPLILPASIPLDDPGIVSQLTGYLPGGWETVIEKDVDGADALPRKLDAEKPNLGRFHASLRVARTLFLGAAPVPGAANRGEEDRRIKLGCVLPGEAPAVFGDALRHLAQAATYLYQDNTCYWRVETFGFAEAFDEAGVRYLGLRGGQVLAFGPDAVGLLVRSSVADLQLEADLPKSQLQVPGSAKPLVNSIESTVGGKSSTSSSEGSPALENSNPPTHFFGSVKVDAARISRDVGTIANEIIQHLASLPNSEIVITVEIQARVSSGVPEHIVRTVSENCRTLKFTSQGFEKE